jgi:hypothetical protein
MQDNLANLILPIFNEFADVLSSARLPIRAASKEHAKMGLPLNSQARPPLPNGDNLNRLEGSVQEKTQLKKSLDLEAMRRRFCRLLSPTADVPVLWYGEATPLVQPDGYVLSDLGKYKDSRAKGDQPELPPEERRWLGLRYLVSSTIDDVNAEAFPGWGDFLLEPALFNTSNRKDLYWLQAHLGRSYGPEVEEVIRAFGKNG